LSSSVSFDWIKINLSLDILYIKYIFLLLRFGGFEKIKIQFTSTVWIYDRTIMVEKRVAKLVGMCFRMKNYRFNDELVLFFLMQKRKSLQLYFFYKSNSFSTYLENSEHFEVSQNNRTKCLKMQNSRTVRVKTEHLATRHNTGIQRLKNT
jgi:hypothetical protein